MSSNPHWETFRDRRQPGPGAGAPDDGNRGHLRTKSIPNVPDARLVAEHSRLHDDFHTAEGLRRHDGPRRELIENGMKSKMIAHEMMLRGLQTGSCEHCQPPDVR